MERDEGYIVAGHKGPPKVVLPHGRFGRRRRLKGAPGCGTLEKEKPPILGMIQRGGEVVMQMLANIPQAPIQPLIRRPLQPGTLIFTEEYAIYHPLEAGSYAHKPVKLAPAQDARDDDGDRFCAVPVNSLDGFGALLRAGLRPYRGISQAPLPLYRRFFEFVLNVRRRGLALLASLLSLLVAP